MTAEALYLRALLGEEWTVEEEVPRGHKTPHTLWATRGKQRIELRLRFNGGDPYYGVGGGPYDVVTMLRAHRIQPARRR